MVVISSHILSFVHLAEFLTRSYFCLNLYLSPNIIGIVSKSTLSGLGNLRLIIISFENFQSVYEFRRYFKSW